MKKLLPVIAILLLTLSSCKKDDAIKEPEILIKSIDHIEANKAVITIKIDVGDCDKNRGELGVCWAKNPAPTIADSKEAYESCKRGANSNLTNLTSNTKYYVRPFIKNSSGVMYGNEVSFTTLP